MVPSASKKRFSVDRHHGRKPYEGESHFDYACKLRRGVQQCCWEHFAMRGWRERSSVKSAIEQADIVQIELSSVTAQTEIATPGLTSDVARAISRKPPVRPSRRSSSSWSAPTRYARGV